MKNETYHLLYSKERNVELHIENSAPNVNNVTSYTTRCQDEKHEVGCYTINDLWDFIVVRSISLEREEATGIIVPLFTIICLAPNNCVFSVDMGDCYTTIMHKRQHEHVAQRLNIGEDYHVPSILCPKDVDFKRLIKKYFGGVSDSNRSYSSFKNLLNVMYDIEHNPQNGRLMENYNIILDYEDFLYRADGNIIKPSLHNLHRPFGIDILRIYLEGLLFVMKQEAMWRYNTPTFDLRIAVPSYLNAEERDIFENVWRAARYVSGTDANKSTTTFVSDSAAQAFFTHYSLLLPETFVNINIDSTHTLIAYCNNIGRVHTLCVDMGIGDLFQNPCRWHKDVSFVHSILQHYLSGICSSDKIREIDSHIQNAQWSLFDIFENEPELGRFLRYGQLGECIKQIEVIFLLGLSYHIGKYLDNMNLDQPRTVVFSGVGSKYLKLYFRECKEIEHLFCTVLRLVRSENYESGDTKILFAGDSSCIISNGLMRDGFIEDETIDVYYGLDNSNDETICFQDATDMNVWDDIHSAFQHFIGILSDNEIGSVLMHYLNTDFIPLINALEAMARDSVHWCLNENMQVHKPESRCYNALFFWNFKHSLYEWLIRNC